MLGVALLSTVACRSTQRFSYPQARMADVVDDHHGTLVSDPYRWLEDPDSQESRAWIEAENEITFGYLDDIPERARIKDRLTKLWNYERYGLPTKRGHRYFFTKNDGLQNQNVYYVTEGLNGTPRMLLDPNKLSEDGTVSVMGASYTDDGSLMAYSISTSGSDWREVKVRDVGTGADLTDHLQWVKFSGLSWSKNEEGFYYSRYDAPDEQNKLQGTNYYQKLFYHRVGEPQSEDTLVYQRKDHKDWGFGGDTTDDGKFLIIGVWKGTMRKNMVFYKDLTDPGAEVVELIDEFEADYSFIDNNGPIFWFKTDLDAPRYRVVEIDIRRPEKRYWREVIPEAPETLQSVSLLGGNKFICSYLNDARSQVKVYDVVGNFVREVEFPVMGSAYGFGGKRMDTETFYAFSSFTVPTTIYHYDVTTGESTVFRRPEVDVDPALYTTRQVFYQSKDGTRVPMFITHKKGVTLNGDNPTLLYGYGGFNISITPRFSVTRLVWLEMGGVYAVANLRGGGEYGKEWHEAGMKLNKQNVFDDFIAAAEWLIDNGYTNSSRLAIQGGSNGGLLVGAVMTQRPDLFGCCLPAVGVMDMLR
ncbi:MAG: prolyl oligopeptidase family protein, partial [Phycisphaerae bacterium]